MEKAYPELVGDEICQVIDGFEEYEITSHGRIISFKRKGIGRFIKSHKQSTGYKQINLRKNGQNHFKLVHRLVLETFDPNIVDPQKVFVDHIDTDINNNYIYNLRWCTHSENLRNRHTWSTSGFKGVYSHQNGKFYVGINGKSHGTYKYATTAAHAYDLEIIMSRNSFKRLNFPEFTMDERLSYLIDHD